MSTEHEEIEAELMKASNVDPIMQYFKFGHLRPDLAAVSASFAGMALLIYNSSKRNPERTAALRKLLEAKDCTIRSCISDPL